MKAANHIWLLLWKSFRERLVWTWGWAAL